MMGLLSLASALFLVASPLISNYLNLPLGKVMEAGVLPIRNGGQKGLRAWESHRPPLSFTPTFFTLTKLILPHLLQLFWYFAEFSRL